MNFLKKLGGIIAAVSGVWLGFSPSLSKQFPQTGGVIQTISSDLAEVGNAVVAIEAIGQLQGLTGPDKAKAVAPQIAQIILNSTLVAGKQIQDQAMFMSGCQEVGQGIADILNSIHHDATATVTAPLQLKA